jgi:hypothetical protein
MGDFEMLVLARIFRSRFRVLVVPDLNLLDSRSEEPLVRLDPISREPLKGQYIWHLV